MKSLIQCLILSIALFALVRATPLKLKPTYQKLEQIAILADETRSYRLPNDTIPLKYDVELSTDIHSGVSDFNGTVKIEIEVVKKTASIVLQVRQLTIVEVKLFRSNTVTQIPLLPISEADDLEFLTIRVQTGLLVGDKVRLEIEYMGQLRNDNLGFYKSSYTDAAGEKFWIAATQLAATEARQAFPCYDEPQIRAKFSIRIKHDKSYNALSNWPVDTRNDVPGTEYVLTEFKETEPMQTYLIAFIISPFKSVDNLTAPTPQRLFARPDAIDLQEGSSGLFYGVELLEKYKEHLGVGFDPPKMDQVAIPDFDAGAMENVSDKSQNCIFF